MFPFGYCGNVDAIEYNVYRLCQENNIYSVKYINLIKRVLSNKCPEDVINKIIKYLAKHILDFNNFEFSLVNKEDIKDSLIVCQYFNYFSKKMYLTLKNK